MVFLPNDVPATRRHWPAETTSLVPFWLYSDPEIYRLEQERIFAGPAWSYVALEAELPNAGDFKRSDIGDKPIVVVRDGEGEINVVVNRCAHSTARCGWPSSRPQSLSRSQPRSPSGSSRTLCS